MRVTVVLRSGLSHIFTTSQQKGNRLSSPHQGRIGRMTSVAASRPVCAARGALVDKTPYGITLPCCAATARVSAGENQGEVLQEEESNLESACTLIQST